MSTTRRHPAMERCPPRRGGKSLLMSCGLALVVCATPVSAQWILGTDVESSSRSVWRGLTARNGPVIQPSIFATFRQDRTVLTAGAWTTIEPGSVDVSDLGTDKVVFGEVNVWAEASRKLGPVEAATGVAGYYFDRSATTRLLHEVRQTHEIYARAQIGKWKVVPRAAAWYDFDSVNGLFLEGGATVRLPLWSGIMVPVGSLLLNADSGFSLGQQVDPDRPDDAAYFQQSGLAYVDLSLAVTFGYIPMGILNNAIHLEVHSQINRDDRTKFVNGLEMKDVKWWVSLTLTSMGPRCRPTQDLCPQ